MIYARIGGCLNENKDDKLLQIIYRNSFYMIAVVSYIYIH